MSTSEIRVGQATESKDTKPAAEKQAPETPKKSEAKANASTPTEEKVQSATPAPVTAPTVSEPHALDSGWTFHMDRKQKRGASHKDFTSGLKTICSFKTIEQFYDIWSFIKKPDALPPNVNIYMFREGLVPAWESFPNGGHWIIKVTKGNGLITTLWDELVMAVLGEQFGTKELVGIALSVRARNDVLTLWNRDNNENNVRFKLGERLKTILNLHHNTTVEYKDFGAAIKDKSTTRDAKQYIYVPQN